jgi:hypothetical protein
MALALFWLDVPVVRLDGVELRLGTKAIAMLAMLSIYGHMPMPRRDVGRQTRIAQAGAYTFDITLWQDRILQDTKQLSFCVQ